MGQRFVGRTGIVQVGGNPIANIRSWEFSETSPQIDMSAMGDTFAEQRTGLASGGGRCTAWWDPTDADGQTAIVRNAELTLLVGPDGIDSGDTVYTLSIEITDITRRADVQGGVEMDFAFVLRSEPVESVMT